MELSSRQEALIWICNHQLGRRNLTPERRKYLIGKRYEAEKQVSQNRGNQYTSAKKDGTDQNDPCQNKSGSHVTRQRIAKETGTSEGYVQRAEKYMNGVEAADEAAPGAREEIAQMLAISLRSAYNLCNSTTEFRVLRVGGSIRIPKDSFDAWLRAA